MRLPVLLYHHVGSNPTRDDPELTISPQEFERQIVWMVRRGYTGIRPADWLAARNGMRLPKRPVLLTFDDGYEDAATHALPILQRFGFSAGVFIVTAEIGGSNRWERGESRGLRRLMSAGQIQYWARQGVEFGAHGRTHTDLTCLDDAEMRDEVAGSAEDLARVLGSRVISFAYPFGSCDERVRRCVRSAYDLAFTADEGLNGPDTDPHLLRRCDAWPGVPLIHLACRMRWGWSPLDRLRLGARNALRAAARRAAKPTRSHAS